MKTQTLFVTLMLAMLFSLAHVYGQLENTTEVKYDVRIDDIDLATDTAQVNITVTISNLNTTGIPPTEPIRAIISGEIDNVQINCTRNIDGDFVGSSGMMPWSLGGELGKGQCFPFEKYELTFQLVNILPLSPNMSMIKARDLDSFAYFEGPKKVVLSHTFTSSPTNVGPRVDMFFQKDSLRAVVFLSRSENESILWLLIAPTIACSYVLISTILPRRRLTLANRLLVYISLLAFGPTFLMAIQSYLPFRASLSIPEVLAENLIISTAIFSALSLLQAQTVLQELIRDTFILFISFFSCSYILVHFEPLFPIAALPVFILAILPYAVAIFGILTYRNCKYLVMLSLDLKHIILGFSGIVLMEIGFFFAATNYGAYLALFDYASNISGIIWLAIGAMGLTLVSLSGCLARLRTRRFNDGVV
ncbi:hypothetical protein MUP37_04610 [Candidatus Bathyarchaeota archaeon]|nr:hypothetical protein [Candidatus Bathyarchaeota archaeon]